MRKWSIVAILAIAFLGASSASAQPVGSAECRYLTTQIQFFEQRLERAEALGDDVWVDRMEAHVNRLSDRRADRCPGYGDGDAAAAAFAQLVSLAARGALTFFTLGAF